MGEWKLVPVEPDAKMRVAGIEAAYAEEIKGAPLRDVIPTAYQAMLAASPTPSLPEDVARVVERLEAIDEEAMYEAPASSVLAIASAVALIQSLSSQLVEVRAELEQCNTVCMANIADRDRLAAELERKVAVAKEALLEARSELEEYEQADTGESYNNPKLNAALASLEDRA